MSSDPETEPPLRSALRAAASALKADEVPFALTGGYALWVHGAPEPSHDVDFAVPEEEVEGAVASLAAAGFEIERPPEDWLFKAHRDGAMVDVLHRLQGHPVDRSLVAASAEQEILGLRIAVMPPTEIMAAKLGSLSEHHCDLAPLLAVARAVREQLDWERLRAEARERPFAEAFLLLTDWLGISGPAQLA